MRLAPAAIAICLLGCPVAWAEPGLRVSRGREDTKIRVDQQQDGVVLDVTCPFGIDRVTVSRTAERWPASVVVRLRTKGLEGFEASSGMGALCVSATSTKAPVFHWSLRQEGGETPLDKNSPYWTEARIVAEKKSIPLENGYFEIPLPGKLFERNPPSLDLRWVDFYRH